MTHRVNKFEKEISYTYRYDMQNVHIIYFNFIIWQGKKYLSYLTYFTLATVIYS